MNKFLMCMLFLLTGTGLLAQARFSFSGHVRDARSGEPLSGATIYFSDLRKGAVTNEKGEFRLSSLTVGQYLVEVSHLGYATQTENISFSGDVSRDYSLQPSIIENEGVTVTGVSSATSTRRTPIPVNIIRREELFHNSSTNLIDNISRTPGVSQVSTGPAVSKPFIRGLGYNRVVVVNDGVRHEGQPWGDEHGVEIDELSVGRVEVLKGPASLMYGGDALAGVLNIISVQPAPEGRIRGNFLASLLSNNRQRNLHADIGGNRNGIIWGFYGSYKAANDFHNKYDGYVFNSRFNERNFGGYLGMNKGWGFTHLVFSAFNQKFGVVEGERDDATGKFLVPYNDNGVESFRLANNSDRHTSTALHPYQHLQHYKILSDNSVKVGKDRLVFTLGYQKDIRSEYGDVTLPNTKSLGFDLDVFNYNLQYHLAEKNKWRTTIGLNGMAENSGNKGVEFLIPAYSLFDIGSFLHSQKRIGELTLSGGLRLDNRSLHGRELKEGSAIKFAAFDKSFTNFSASAGLAWQVNKEVNLKFNLARGFRAPSIPELSSNGAHEGTNRYEYGELDLKSETSWQGDLGVELGTEHVSFNGNIFLNAVKDFIFYRKLQSASGGDSIIASGSDNFFAFRFAQDNAYLYGVEFNLDIHPHPLDWLHIENTFSFVRGLLSEAQDGSRNLPFIPAPRLIDQLKVDLFRDHKRFHNVFALVELDNHFSQSNAFTGYGTETDSPGYSLLNAAIGGDIRRKEKTIFSVVISGNNLTDVTYQDHLSRLKYAAENLVTGRRGVFNMGRNFSFKLNVPFSSIFGQWK